MSKTCWVCTIVLLERCISKGLKWIVPLYYNSTTVLSIGTYEIPLLWSFMEGHYFYGWFILYSLSLTILSKNSPFFGDICNFCHSKHINSEQSNDFFGGGIVVLFWMMHLDIWTTHISSFTLWRSPSPQKYLLSKHLTILCIRTTGFFFFRCRFRIIIHYQ